MDIYIYQLEQKQKWQELLSQGEETIVKEG